jgi:hypothetical protein
MKNLALIGGGVVVVVVVIIIVVVMMRPKDDKHKHLPGSSSEEEAASSTEESSVAAAGQRLIGDATQAASLVAAEAASLAAAESAREGSCNENRDCKATEYCSNGTCTPLPKYCGIKNSTGLGKSCPEGYECGDGRYRNSEGSQPLWASGTNPVIAYCRPKQ